MNGKPYLIYAVMTASSLRNQTKEMTFVVIVSRLDYLNKMKQLISDNTKFNQLK